ncbi:MAG: ImmA/IrrE family metallo-endopeptidase [Beijerinckiaceae bacterium]|nr:ImmA/IrrE family metallo-endopeptidase [Beijerinckiaceae bacterium]
MHSWNEDEIEARAHQLRQAIGVDNTDWLDAQMLVQKIMNLLPGINLLLVEDSELPDPGGQWHANKQQLIFRKSVFESGIKPDSNCRARWTIVHELMHAYLGHAGIRNRSAQGSPEKLSTKIRRIETITDRFTAAVLAPFHRIKPQEDAVSIAARFGLSKTAAEIRADQAARDYRRKNRLLRPIPDSVRQVIDELKAQSLRPRPRQAAEWPLPHNVLKLWDKATSIPGEDPTEYRQSPSGYRIKKSEFNKVSSQGWFVENGYLHAALERHDCN